MVYPSPPPLNISGLSCGPIEDADGDNRIDSRRCLTYVTCINVKKRLLKNSTLCVMSLRVFEEVMNSETLSAKSEGASTLCYNAIKI